MEKRRFTRSSPIDNEFINDEEYGNDMNESSQKEKSSIYSNKSLLSVVVIFIFCTTMMAWIHYNSHLSSEVFETFHIPNSNVHQAITHVIMSETAGIFSHHHLNAIQTQPKIIKTPIELAKIEDHTLQDNANNIQAGSEKENPVIKKEEALAQVTTPKETKVQDSSIPTVDEIEQQITKLRHMKFQDHLVMETNALALTEIAKLQSMLRPYLLHKYGPEPYHVEMELKFPVSMISSSSSEKKESESIVFELAPLQYAPYSVYYMLNIIEHWQGGAFHRNAGHVLQAMSKYHTPSLAFQEYNDHFPHKQYTLGYAGRPGGPEFYISTIDNTQNHGYGSQGSKTEADSCFGKIIDGFPVIKRMQQQTKQDAGPMGFIKHSENYIRIVAMRLLVVEQPSV